MFWNFKQHLIIQVFDPYLWFNAFNHLILILNKIFQHNSILEAFFPHTSISWNMSFSHGVYLLKTLLPLGLDAYLVLHMVITL